MLQYFMLKNFNAVSGFKVVYIHIVSILMKNLYCFVMT